MMQLKTRGNWLRRYFSHDWKVSMNSRELVALGLPQDCVADAFDALKASGLIAKSADAAQRIGEVLAEVDPKNWTTINVIKPGGKKPKERAHDTEACGPRFWIEGEGCFGGGARATDRERN